MTSNGEEISSGGWHTNSFGPRKRLNHPSGLYVNLVLPLAVDLPAFRLEPDQLDWMIELLVAAKAECVSCRQGRLPAELGGVA